jgi:hypothetical protein
MDEHYKHDFRSGGSRFFLRGEEKQSRRRPRRSSRRLITLISAGLGIRMVMIRRELPRTRNAGWARRACRIKHMRVLLLADPSAVPSTVSLSHRGPVTELRAARLSGQLPLRRFGFDSNGPDESQHLSTNRGDDLRFVLSICPRRDTAPSIESAPCRRSLLHRRSSSSVVSACICRTKFGTDRPRQLRRPRVSNGRCRFS